MWSSALGTLTKYWILRISLLENPHIGFSEDFDHISNMKTVQKKRMEHFDYTNLINKILFIYAVPVEWLPVKHKSNILAATANSCFTNYLRELDEMVEIIFIIRQEKHEQGASIYLQGVWQWTQASRDSLLYLFALFHFNHKKENIGHILLSIFGKM